MADALRRLPIVVCGGPLAYLWLVYALAVPVTLLGGGPARIILLQAGVFVAFLVLYAVGWGRRGRTALAVAAASVLLGVVASPTDPAATTYFIYSVSFVAWGVPASTAYRIVLVYTPLVAAFVWWARISPYYAVPAVVFTVIVALACIAGAESSRAHERLQQAYRENERLTQIAERERIARDLHDVLGHTLSLISLKSQLATKLAERDPQRALDEIRAVESIARTSLDELRAAVAGYRAAGISNELAHARDVLTSAGLRVECDADEVRLGPANESVLALAIREAVTNVVRHARATVVRLRLAGADGACRFEIEDDGVGGAEAEGMGLGGMRERIEAHGGSLERTSTNGTRLIVTLPLAERSVS